MPPLAFTTLLLSMSGGAIIGLDRWVAASLHAQVTPAAAAVMHVVTQLGSTAVLVLVTALAAVVLLRLGRRGDAAFVVVALAGAEALTWSLKAVFQRERPSFADPVATASSFSYPSGHALISLAVYGGLAYLLLGSLRSARARNLCLGFAALVVAAIGFSRLYLGVHYLSDVLAGYAFAFAWLVALVAIRRWDGLRRVSPAAVLAPRLRSSSALVVVAAVLAAGCGGDNGDEPAPALPRGSEPIQLDADDFVERVDNEYWPMSPGTRWVYSEQDPEGGELRVEVTVTDRTRTILGIDATVVHDVVEEDGEVIEDTYDWYAQDRWGNVWYLGEDTKEFENGKVVSTEGSWEAGVDGAQAGVIVPGEPKVGAAYRQEYYEGEAEDNGEILSLDARASVPAGTYEGVLKTKDTNALEPKVLEHKYYAKGVGPVLAVDVSGGGREELLRFESG
jgi:membrane-associated phospholipid phosphatase